MVEKMSVKRKLSKYVEKEKNTKRILNNIFLLPKNVPVDKKLLRKIKKDAK